jgi:hypothetical protein
MTVILWLLCAGALLSSAARAQSVDSAAIPEMARLAKGARGGLEHGGDRAAW